MDPAPTLMLLNGLPASGKSTLAARLADRRPSTLVLDVDRVRAMLGASLAQPDAAGAAARVLALAIARAHLGAGQDVVVPQHLGRPAFLLQLEALAAEVRARFVEVLLEVPVAVASRRFAARSAAGALAEHRDAAILLEAAGGEAELERMRRRLDALVAGRPATVRISAADGAVDHAVTMLIRLLPDR